MMDVDAFKVRLKQRLQNEALATLCLEVVDFLSDASNEELQSITFLTLANILKLDEIDERVISVAAILRKSKPKVFDLHYYYITDDEEFEVDLSEALHAIQNGVFIDRRGNMVDNPESKLFPFFSISAEFIKVKMGSYE